MKIAFLILSLVVFNLSTSDAQLFKRLSKSVQDKMEQRIEDKVVEETSDRIVNAAMRPIDNAMDAMFRAQYRETYGEEYDESKYADDPEGKAELMNEMLSAMYAKVDLPDQYKLEYTLDIEVKDHKKKNNNKMKIYFGPEQKVMAISSEENSKDQLMVMDMAKDQMLIFNTKEKTVLGLPKVMKMAGRLSKVQEEESPEIEIKKLYKSKKIAGYISEGYQYKSKEDKGEFYMSDDAPFSYSDVFDGALKQYTSMFYADNNDLELKGLLMYSEMIDENGHKYTWEVKKINSDSWSIDCSEYRHMTKVDR